MFLIIFFKICCLYLTLIKHYKIDILEQKQTTLFYLGNYKIDKAKYFYINYKMIFLYFIKI
jgi:hypothetical protein